MADFSAGEFALRISSSAASEFCTAKFSSGLFLLSAPLLTTELRTSEEPQSGPVSPQPLNSSSTGKHDKACRGFLPKKSIEVTKNIPLLRRAPRLNCPGGS